MKRTAIISSILTFLLFQIIVLSPWWLLLIFLWCLPGIFQIILITKWAYDEKEIAYFLIIPVVIFFLLPLGPFLMPSFIGDNEYELGSQTRQTLKELGLEKLSNIEFRLPFKLK